MTERRVSLAIGTLTTLLLIVGAQQSEAQNPRPNRMQGELERLAAWLIAPFPECSNAWPELFRAGKVPAALTLHSLALALSRCSSKALVGHGLSLTPHAPTDTLRTD